MGRSSIRAAVALPHRMHVNEDAHQSRRRTKGNAIAGLRCSQQW
jgi:hypothetical protein